MTPIPAIAAALIAVGLIVQPLDANPTHQAPSASSARQADPDLVVYLTEGGTIFHRQQCESLTGHKVIAVKLKDLPPGAEECSHCRPLERPAAPPPRPKTLLEDACYLVDGPTSVHKMATATSPVLARLGIFDVVQVYEGAGGWLHVQTLGERRIEGWLKAKPENVIEADWLTVTRRLVDAQVAHWPAATSLDVARGRVRIGFTRAQVAAALGEPTRKTSDETAAGVTEILIYPGRVITLKAGRVTKITSVN